jgi:cellulose biosynthesis protein BcsQ
MKIIALCTQKGGSGKSTLCASLAFAAHEAGNTVAILEIDKQATIAQWAQARQGKPPDAAQTTADKLEAIMGRLAGAGYGYVFIDTPGVDSPGTNLAIRLSDLCLIPCRPTLADLRAMAPTLGAIHRLERDFAFVLNQALLSSTSCARRDRVRFDAHPIALRLRSREPGPVGDIRPRQHYLRKRKRRRVRVGCGTGQEETFAPLPWAGANR